MPHVTINRRTLFAAAAATPLLGVAANAKAPMQGATQATFARYTLGAFEVTTLLDATRPAEDPQKTFGMNVDPSDFADESRKNFIPHDKYQGYFTPTLINTGAELVLFDTGLGRPGGIRDQMVAAGYSPDQVDIVVLTHMHPDHIGGLMVDGAPAYPNARYVTGAVEYNFWSGPGAGNRVGEMVAKLVTPLADKMTFIDPETSVVPGITALEAFGHTPGHMAYMIESQGQHLMLTADLANHHVWSLANPTWEVRFDADKKAAAEARFNLLGMLAADRIPMVGYHLPFPAVGFVASTDTGFRFEPATYQLNL